MVTKGHDVRYGYHKNFSVAEVKNMRSDYLKGATQKQLAETYDCSIKMVYNIVHLKNYTDVEVEDGYLEMLKER